MSEVYMEVKVFSKDGGRNALIDRLKGNPDMVISRLKYKYCPTAWEVLEERFLEEVRR